ncbi:MAG: arginase [Halobacteriaceae archaeon]
MTDEVRLLGVPTDYGTNRRGVDMGPSAIRYAGLADALDEMGLDVTDTGNLATPRAGARDGRHETEARFLAEVMEVTGMLSDAVADARADGAVPVVLGGDHSIAIGTLAGAAREEDVGVVWFDAHADCNTPETSPSGNVHGMPLAAALGWGSFEDFDWAHAAGLAEENVALVGLRDLDPGERAAIRASDATAFTMREIDERGIGPVVADALDAASAGVDALHVSFDLDFLDPNEAPGVGTPVRGGATYREAHAAMEIVADRDDVRSLEVVEVNPILDRQNETAELAVELLCSAFGRRVL